MAHLINASARKVGGIHFLKLGRINLSFSVSKAAPAPVKRTCRALVQLGPNGTYQPVVRIMEGKRTARIVTCDVRFPAAELAMAHARAAIVSCGLPLAR